MCICLSYIFGPENTIVGVIFTIMMSASMVRDLTATPLRHLVTQALVLVWMALAAYWVNALPAPLSVFVHFITTAGYLCMHILMNIPAICIFPYILSYLFLIFISPVSADQLPGRIGRHVDRSPVHYPVPIVYGKESRSGDCQGCAQ